MDQLYMVIHQNTHQVDDGESGRSLTKSHPCFPEPPFVNQASLGSNRSLYKEGSIVLEGKVCGSAVHH